jgi:hypothetical protein
VQAHAAGGAGGAGGAALAAGGAGAAVEEQVVGEGDDTKKQLTFYVHNLVQGDLDLAQIVRLWVPGAETWECGACTLVNAGNAWEQGCAACGGARPGDFVGNFAGEYAEVLRLVEGVLDDDRQYLLYYDFDAAAGEDPASSVGGRLGNSNTSLGGNGREGSIPHVYSLREWGQPNQPQQAGDYTIRIKTLTGFVMRIRVNLGMTVEQVR